MIVFADTKGVRSLCNKEVCLGIYTTKVVPLRLISYKKKKKKKEDCSKCTREDKWRNK
jgi:hypothetical protein